MKNNISWQTKKLGEICDIVGGGTPKTNNKKYWGDDFYWATPKDLGKLKSLRISETERKISRDGLKYSSAKLLPIGSVILSSRAPIGYVVINSVEMATNQGCRSFICGSEIYNKYLYYFLFSNTKYLNSLGGGTTFKEISGSVLKEIEIPLPPLSEQKRIVKILDEVLGKIAKAKENTEKNLQNAKELFESYLQNVFSNPGKDWEENTLEDVCEIQSKLIDPRKSKFLDLVHVGAGNIEIKTGKLINLKTSRGERLISGKFLFDNSMVLYSKIRPYLMKVVRPDFNGLCSADIYPLVPRTNLITRDFLYFLLLSKKFTDYAIKGSARAGMPKVNREHLFAYSFFLPKVSEQKSIVKKLDALSAETKKLEAIYKQKLEDLEELKKSVLKSAFAGKL